MNFKLYFLRVFLTILVTVVGHLLPITAYTQPSPFYRQVLPLIGANSQIIEVGENTVYADYIENIILNIFSTNSGKAFCGATTDNFQVFKSAFFISEKNARIALPLCSGFFATKQPHRFFPKKYFIVIIPNDDYIADGWTTPQNETYLFVSKKEFTVERITRSLIHEFAISLDRKEQIGFAGTIDFPRLGIISNQDSCDVISIIRKSLMKNVLSALRAFEVEKKISDDLNIPLPEGFSDWAGVECSDKIKRMRPYVQKLNLSMAAIDLFNLLSDQPDCRSADSGLDSFEQGADFLSRSILSFSDGRTQNACEYLTSGWPFYPGASFQGGPGPRIGGGWGSMRIDKAGEAANKGKSTSDGDFIFSDSTENLNSKEKLKLEEILKNYLGISDAFKPSKPSNN